MKIGMVETEMTEAQKSYALLDVEGSKRAHKNPPAAEKHSGSAGKYIKSIVYGGLDGIITVFAVVASIAGAGLEVNVVIIMGIASLLADGISMGMGDYLSSKAENDYSSEERKRELWECENYIEGEIDEMIKLYVGKGMTEKDATLVVETMAKYTDIFVDTMMVEELGLMPVDADDSPLKNGMVTFVAFLIFGCVPLISYISAVAGDKSHVLDHVEGAFIIASALTLMTMFLLGTLTAKFSPQKWYLSGLWIATNGGAAAGIAYLIGWALSVIVGSSTSV